MAGLCPETLSRRAMSDSEFWDHVLVGDQPSDPYEPDLDGISEQDKPCGECGEFSRCGTDTEGRALYHHPTHDDEENDDE